MKIINTILPLALLFTSLSLQAEIAVIVNPAIGDALEQSEISRIFLGKSKKFPSGAAVTPINLPSGDASRKAFDSSVLKKSPRQLKSYWSKQVFTGKGKPPKEVANAAAAIAEVLANANAIAYIDASEVTVDVKVLAKF